MLHLKTGVRLNDLSPQILLAVIVAQEVYREHGVPLTVTSVNDSKHSETSLHHIGHAVDLRTRHLESAGVDAEEVVGEIMTRLTRDYDVILESDHIHIEYQPRR